MAINILATIQALAVLIGLLPAIRDAVRSVEIPGNGEAKRAAVVGIVKAAAEAVDTTGAVKVPVDKVEKYAGAAVDVLVSLENATGAFKRGAPG